MDNRGEGAHENRVDGVKDIDAGGDVRVMEYPYLLAAV